jgi:hypothetical protein
MTTDKELNDAFSQATDTVRAALDVGGDSNFNAKSAAIGMAQCHLLAGIYRELVEARHDRRK